MGQDGMDFQFGGGGYVMSHAAGGVKPWKKNYVLSALNGIKPSIADKAFWQNASSPINAHPARGSFNVAQ